MEQSKSDNSNTDYVTTKLAKQIGDFGSLIGVNTQDPKEHERIANELITDRKFTRPDGIVVSISALDKIISDDPNYKGTLEKEFGAGATLESLIPTAEQRDVINKSARAAKENNSGIFGVGLSNFLVGLLNWAMSGFAGGFSGLKEHAASVAADNVANDMGKNLKASGLFNEKDIKRISGDARAEVLEMAGVKSIKAEEQATVERQANVKEQSANAGVSVTETVVAAGAAATAAVESDKNNKIEEKTSKIEAANNKGEKRADDKKASDKKPQSVTEDEKEKSQSVASTKKIEVSAPPESGKAKTVNLETATNRMIDGFLGKNKELNLTPEQVKSVKVAVYNNLRKNKNDSAMSDPAYSGNYQLLSASLAESILVDAGLSKHELLKETPYTKQAEFFTVKIKEFLGGGNGKELREANLKDKAQNLASAVDLTKVGVSMGDATHLATWKHKGASIGASV